MREPELDEVVLVEKKDLIKQPVESVSQPAFSIPNNMVMISAEIYRYNFLIDCKSYWEDVLVLNALLEQLILFLLTE